MTGKTAAPKGKKLLLFKVLAILFPFVLLILLELALRFFNYGHNTDLFVKDPTDERFMVMNNYASDKFFSDTSNATGGNHELFTIDKAPNTFRIFVLGESTTIGYPYFHNGSFHRWLQYRLEHEYPNVNFEVINLSLTAVNSYTVLNFGRQLPQYHPDAVLIYTGHNEYYGALGVGSTSYVGSNRFLVETLIKLRGLKLVQLLNNSMKKIAVAFSSSKPADRETLMKRMAARQHIELNSTDYQAGINQYDANMTELCQILNDNKIPTFLSNVVSNEKDLAPFISNGSGPVSASFLYNAGQQAMAKGDYSIAKQDFVQAKELDELRFRAPEAINGIIKKLTIEYSSVHLVDTKAGFEQGSPNGIIGHETILEHVHPNLQGYALMSDAFYRAIKAQNILPGTPVKEISFAELQSTMPITRLDSLNGEYQVLTLETGWPFNKPMPADFKLKNTLEDTLAQVVGQDPRQWGMAMGRLFDYDKQTDNKKGALKVLEAMALEDPQNQQFCGLAANLNAILGNFDEAAYYYTKLYQLSPSDQTLQTLCQAYLHADKPEMVINYVKDMPQEKQGPIQDLLTQILADKQSLKTKPNDPQLMAHIAANYKLLGIPEMVQKYAAK